MGLAEMKSLPVAEISEPNAVLFLWVVQSMLPQALELLAAWDFTFKTVAFAWVKMPKRWHDRTLFTPPFRARLGMGYHTRSGFEQCWLATRGAGYRRIARDVEQVIHSPVREHSRKPSEIRERIDALVGMTLPRIELFARGTIPAHWCAWGNEFEPGQCGELAAM